MRGRMACRTPSQAASMSFLFALESPQITGTYPSSYTSLPTFFAMPRTASKSSGLAIGNPASMTSTPSLANDVAMSSFSLLVSVAPGDCSPSRSVVSNTRTYFGSEITPGTYAGLGARATPSAPSLARSRAHDHLSRPFVRPARPSRSRAVRRRSRRPSAPSRESSASPPSSSSVRASSSPSPSVPRIV